MECREALKNMDKFLEGRLTDIEEHSLKKHLEKCKKCSKEYEETKQLFNLLLNHKIVLPPLDFTQKIMSRIHHYNETKKSNYKNIRNWGISFVAAGILIILLNVASVRYTINDFTSDVYTGVMQINHKILSPIIRIQDSINTITKGVE